MPVELPIAFASHHVRSLLDSSKTSTLRAVTHRAGAVLDAWEASDGWRAKVLGRVASVLLRCPYVSIGRGTVERPQFLWVKEAIRRDVRKHADVCVYEDGRPVLVCAACGKAPTDLDGHERCQPLTRIEQPYTWTEDVQDATLCERWASRILLACEAWTLVPVTPSTVLDSAKVPPDTRFAWRLQFRRVAP